MQTNRPIITSKIETFNQEDDFGYIKKVTLQKKRKKDVLSFTVEF
jgi:hypothetical protein